MRKGKRLPLEELAPYLLELPDPPVVLDWSALFRQSQPIEMEIGFGKGAFLVSASETRPNVNFVGVEIDRALQLYVATRLAKRTTPNVLVAKADARCFLRDCVADASLQAVHVYFPDPWWKKRHKKRRVFTEEFAIQCQRVLQPNGRLHLATDVEEYFGVMTELVGQHTSLRPIALESADPDVRTNFERKALEQGRAVWRAIFLR